METDDQLLENCDHYRTEWHWGPLAFHGLFGIHGVCLCFHRHLQPEKPDAIVDPAKPILPLQMDHDFDHLHFMVR